MFDTFQALSRHTWLATTTLNWEQDVSTAVECSTDGTALENLSIKPKSPTGIRARPSHRPCTTKFTVSDRQQPIAFSNKPVLRFAVYICREANTGSSPVFKGLKDWDGTWGSGGDGYSAHAQWHQATVRYEGCHCNWSLAREPLVGPRHPADDWEGGYLQLLGTWPGHAWREWGRPGV